MTIRVMQQSFMVIPILPHPVGAAAVIACLSETERLDTKVNAQVRGTQLYNGVMELAKKHTIVGDVRGGMA